MDRIKALNRYQKGILLLLLAMIVVFGVVYSVVSSREGFLYMDEIFLPSEENGSTIYSGVIQGKGCRFTVTPESKVIFHCGDQAYGPYTVREDPTAVPDDKDYLTGVEILDGDAVFFRGGFYRSGDGMMLFDEDGELFLRITAVVSGGTVVDGDGNIVDPMVPSPSTILQLMEGPELTSKGAWPAWILGLLVSVLNTVSILFADELFRWNLTFRIRNAYDAEPSDWEIAGRYIGWIALTIMVFVIYIIGLQ